MPSGYVLYNSHFIEEDTEALSMVPLLTLEKSRGWGGVVSEPRGSMYHASVSITTNLGGPHKGERKKPSSGAEAVAGNLIKDLHRSSLQVPPKGRLCRGPR